MSKFPDAQRLREQALLVRKPGETHRVNRLFMLMNRESKRGKLEMQLSFELDAEEYNFLTERGYQVTQPELHCEVGQDPSKGRFKGGKIKW